MRKILAILLSVFLLCPGVQAAEIQPKYAALTFENCPGRNIPELLDALDSLGAKATFFLRGDRMLDYPEQAKLIAERGHEIGLSCFGSASFVPLTRRQIAGELSEAKALLPKKCDIAFVRPPDGVFTHGLHQVAQVTNLSLLGWSEEPFRWETKEGHLTGQIRDGDVIRIRDISAGSIGGALSLIRQLQKRGYRLVTVSQLAKARKIRIHPGETYTAFPQKKTHSAE